MNVIVSGFVVCHCQGESLRIILGNSENIITGMGDYLAVAHDALLRGVVAHQTLAANCLLGLIIQIWILVIEYKKFCFSTE